MKNWDERVFFIKYFIYLFLEKGKGRDKERETAMCESYIDWLVASGMPPTRDLARNPGMCPD